MVEATAWQAAIRQAASDAQFYRDHGDGEGVEAWDRLERDQKEQAASDAKLWPVWDKERRQRGSAIWEAASREAGTSVDRLDLKELLEGAVGSMAASYLGLRADINWQASSTCGYVCPLAVALRNISLGIVHTHAL